MKHVEKHILSFIFICCISGISFAAAQMPPVPEEEKEILSKERTPLIFALGEGLNNPHLAQDEDLGMLDTSVHPRTVAAYEFLNAYMDGKIRLDLIAADSAQVLRAYMQDLLKNNLRFTSFRLGVAQPQNRNLYQIQGKLIGFGKKTLVLLTMVQQSDQKWKILAFSADYPL